MTTTDPLRDPAAAWDSPIAVVPECAPSAFFGALAAANTAIEIQARAVELMNAAAAQLETWRGRPAIPMVEAWRVDYLAQLITELRSTAEALAVPR
ncbi:hypothetical protein B1R94_02080 [Mycolicibacterium litorale]|nr:hypothetical protein B1R94_02080 [Mycolicibacterium litorale]